jgi:hypothetical protein
MPAASWLPSARLGAEPPPFLMNGARADLPPTAIANVESL